MNSAYYHLALNHIPTVGLLIGILVLAIGLFIGQKQVKITALSILVFSVVMTIVVFQTGEAAEETVEHMAGINESYIHEHEEYAELFMKITVALGIIALISLVAEIKKAAYAKYLIFITLAVGVADGVAAKYVGTSGGEIRHTEIRGTQSGSDAQEGNDRHDDHDDEEDD